MGYGYRYQDDTDIEYFNFTRKIRVDTMTLIPVVWRTID